MLIVGFCMRYGRNAACSRRLISILPIAGFAGSAFTARGLYFVADLTLLYGPDLRDYLEGMR